MRDPSQYTTSGFATNGRWFAIEKEAIDLDLEWYRLTPQTPADNAAEERTVMSNA